MLWAQRKPEKPAACLATDTPLPMGFTHSFVDERDDSPTRGKHCNAVVLGVATLEEYRVVHPTTNITDAKGWYFYFLGMD